MPFDSSVPEQAISVRGLQKIYRPRDGGSAKEALKGVDLDVPVGSIFGLLGPNGAGKSTFINILAGLVTKTAGSVAIWSYDQDAAPRRSRASIGVVPQELNLDPFFSPREAMEIQAGFYGVPKSERRTDALLEKIGLADKADAYARTLSGGMRRRLLIGKALVHNPPVLILDEPTAGVDIELRRQLWDYVRELNAQGVTIVLTTHYLEEAEEMCDRIAILHQGAVAACAAKADLLSTIDRKTVLIDPEAPLPALPDSLASRDDLDASLRPDGRLALTYRKTATRLTDVLEAAQAAGVTVRDISTEEPHLEEVFVSLTSKS